MEARTRVITGLALTSALLGVSIVALAVVWRLWPHYLGAAAMIIIPPDLLIMWAWWWWRKK